MVDTRRYLGRISPGPTPAQRQAFEKIVSTEVDGLRGQTRAEVNIRINELENDPDVSAQIGELAMSIRTEIERRLERG